MKLKWADDPNQGIILLLLGLLAFTVYGSYQTGRDLQRVVN